MSYKAALRVWRGTQAPARSPTFQVEVNEREAVLDVLHQHHAAPSSR